MNVKSIFFKAIVLCAILILSSCQSQEEKVINRLNDLAERIENEGKHWDVIDWEDAMYEYADIYKDAEKCEFSKEQRREFYRACENISLAAVSSGMEAYSNAFTKGMEAFSNGLAKGMKSMQSGIEAFSDGLTESDENEDEDVALPKVYSNCFDGYLNVRAEPSSKSKILGRLPNGPEGAELLGVEGKWSKVRVDGVVGYIWSADVQSTPTEPVYISASDVIGEWIYVDDRAHIQYYSIDSNGKFESNFQSGTWHLSRNKLVLKDSNGEIITCTVDGDIMKINGYEFSRYEE